MSDTVGLPVVHAVIAGDQAYYIRRLDTGKEAIVITTSTDDPNRILDFCGEREVEGIPDRGHA